MCHEYVVLCLNGERDAIGFLCQQIKKTAKKHVVRNLHLNAGINFFCDGACQANPGPSSSGVVIYKDGVLKKLYTGSFKEKGSNNS